MQALGLIPAGTDLAKVYTSLHGSGVLAYYDPALKKMVIKGTKLDVYTRVTVADELTHALDDQNFNLGRVGRDGGRRRVGVAIRSLVDCDATWVMLRYEGSLSARERSEYLAEDLVIRAWLDDKDAADDIPSILDAESSTPTADGALMVDVRRAGVGRPPSTACSRHRRRPFCARGRGATLAAAHARTAARGRRAECARRPVGHGRAVPRTREPARSGRRAHRRRAAAQRRDGHDTTVRRRHVCPPLDRDRRYRRPGPARGRADRLGREGTDRGGDGRSGQHRGRGA